MKFLLFFALGLGVMTIIGGVFRLLMFCFLAFWEIPKMVMKVIRLKRKEKQVKMLLEKISETEKEGSKNAVYKSAIKDNDKTVEFCKKKKRTTKK